MGPTRNRKYTTDALELSGERPAATATRRRGRRADAANSPAAGSGSGVRSAGPVPSIRRFPSPEPSVRTGSAMVLIYWALALPHGPTSAPAWVAGLLLDVLLGSTSACGPWRWPSPPTWRPSSSRRSATLPLAAGADHRSALLVGKITVFWAEHCSAGPASTSPTFGRR